MYKDNEGCIFHHKRWRGQTQRLLNTIRTTGLLSSQHIKHFPKAVCTCTTAATGLGSTTETPDLAELQQWMNNLSADSTMSDVHPLLVSMLKEVKSNSSQFTSSINKALLVLKRAIEGDYSALTPLNQLAPPKPQPPTIKFELPLSYIDLGIYFGSSGSKIKQLCKQNAAKVSLLPIEGVSIGRRYGSLKRKNHMHMYGKKFEAVVTGEVGVAKSSLTAVQKEMMYRAQSVTEQRQKHRENVKTYYSRGFWQKAFYRKMLSGYTTPGTITSAKEAAKEQFQKKKHYNKKRSGAPDKKSLSVLSDGHCLNCLAEYQSGQTQKGACSYHPGYLIPLDLQQKRYRTKWSCCDLLSTETHPAHSSHSQTGCNSGRHIWRPGKAMKKINGQKTIVREPDFFVY